MNEASKVQRTRGSNLKKKNGITGLIRLENLGHSVAIYGYSLEVLTSSYLG